MTDFRLQIEGGDAKKAAAELGAALEFEFDPVGRVGSAPAPFVVAHQEQSGGPAEAGGAATIVMTFGIPSDAVADDELERKIHLLERLRRLIDIAARHREGGTRVHLQVDGAFRELAGMEPQAVLDAARRPNR
jgi:hypothetical protein